MKKAIILLSLFSLSTIASTPSLGDFCYNDSCSVAQEDFWQQYKELEGFEIPNETKLYSGDCYHTSPIYSNSYTHHAALLLDKSDNNFYFNAIFSFFASTNPYIDWDITRAKDRFSDRTANKRKLIQYQDFAFVDLMQDQKTDKPFLMYWLKRDGDRLILLGLWESRHRLICSLKEN